jgi:hypothetical protein
MVAVFISPVHRNGATLDPGLGYRAGLAGSLCQLPAQRACTRNRPQAVGVERQLPGIPRHRKQITRTRMHMGRHPQINPAFPHGKLSDIAALVGANDVSPTRLHDALRRPSGRAGQSGGTRCTGALVLQQLMFADFPSQLSYAAFRH